MHLPPQIALVLTLGFMGFLYVREVRGHRQVTGAVWIPVIWLTIIGSRFLSQWLDIFGIHYGAVNVEDGSPLDAALFGLLILSGLYVLHRRRVSLAAVLQNNRWMAIFLGYCFLAVIWADFPFVALKRWLKVLGHPIMVLVLLTEPDPEEAIVQLLKRISYVWVPVSVLFLKYYPEYGRGFDKWTGAANNTGITTDKNILGLDLFIVGAFFFWYFLKVTQMEKGKLRRNELLLIAVFGWMIMWLLHIAQSSTSLVSVIIASSVMLFLGLRRVNPRYAGTYLLTALCIGIVAEEGFNIYAGMLHLLGKSPTLTDRTLVWQDLLKIKINPIIGTGFESFWLGDRVKPLWEKWWWHPTEAHNAYLETYLNLGLLGLFLLSGWFVATFQKARWNLINGVNWGRFRLGFLVASLFYGWTEVAFRSLDPVFFVSFLIAMDYPRSELAEAEQPAEPERVEAGMMFAAAEGQNRVANNQTSVVMN